MAPRITRMLTAERAGLMAVIAIIVSIAALSMCERIPAGPEDKAALDSAMVGRIDSSAKAYPDTVSHPPAKAGRKKSPVKKADPNLRMRLYLDERVDSGCDDR